jgi:hypothetical protein
LPLAHTHLVASFENRQPSTSLNHSRHWRRIYFTTSADQTSQKFIGGLFWDFFRTVIDFDVFIAAESIP